MELKFQICQSELVLQWPLRILETMWWVLNCTHAHSKSQLLIIYAQRDACNIFVTEFVITMKFIWNIVHILYHPMWIKTVIWIMSLIYEVNEWIYDFFSYLYQNNCKDALEQWSKLFKIPMSFYLILIKFLSHTNYQ